MNLKALGLCLVMWVSVVANVGADGQARIDSIFVDVIKGNYYGAMVRCEDVIAADSTAADAYRFLGWLYIATRQGDLKEARENLQRAVALKPEDAGAQNDLGFVYAFQQNFSPATEAFKRALALKPDETLYGRNLGFVAELAGDYLTSESAFQAVIERDPTDDLAVYGYGLALSKQARYDEALQAFQKAVNIFSGRKDAYLEMGKIRMMQRNYAAAAAVYERAKKIDFEDPKPHYGLAQTYRQLGDSLQAKQEWETFKYFDERHRNEVRDRYVLPVRFDRVAGLLDRGEALARLGRHEEALKVYGKALLLIEDPASPFRFSLEVPLVYLAMGRSHQILGDTANAMRAYNAVRVLGEEGPAADEAKIHLADLFLCTDGLPDDQVRGYERIVAMDPISDAAFWIYNQMSQVQAESGQLDRCVAAYRSMVDQVPYSAGLLVRLGVAYAAVGNLEEATVAYQNVIDGTQDSGGLYLQLSMLYRKAGRVAEADTIAAKAHGK